MWVFPLPVFLLIFMTNALLAESSFSPEEALLWNGPEEPHRTSFNFSGDKLTVITGDSVIITKARLHQKNQVFIRDFIVDLTSPARSGWNLHQQAKRYEAVRLYNHEGFISQQHYHHEYKLHGLLSHSQCLTLCLLEKSQLPATAQQIKELASLYASLQDFFWIKVNQHMLGDSYTLDFHNTQVFPQNLWSNGSMDLFHYHGDRYQIIPNQNLHGLTSYYDFESKKYYNRQFHNLIARMNVNQDIQILVPLLATAHANQFSKSACVCARDLSLNLKNTFEAQAFSRRARYRILRSPRLLEIQRVKRVSDDPLSSNVLSILSNPKFYSSPTFSYMSPTDLHHLRIDDLRNASQRYRRGLPLAAKLSLIMATKLAQFSLPYAFSHQEDFLKKLKTEVQGKFLSVPKQSVSNVSFQSYLNEKFGSGSTSVRVLEDRIRVSYDEPTLSLASLAPPSLSHAKELNGISYDLSYIEKEILPQLSPALLQKLIQHLPFQLNPGSQILLKTTTAGTFQRHRFWLELYRHDLSYTYFQARALPFKVVNGIYTSYSVPNASVLDIAKDENDPLLHKACLTHLLADKNILTADLCATEEYQPKTSELLFTLANGGLYALHGPSVLHLDCFRHVTAAIHLEHEFNVVYVSSSCSASLDKKHKSSIVFATKAVFHQHPYQVLVQLNVPKLSSTYEKIYFWLILLSSACFVLILCFSVAYAFFYYIRFRYKPRLSVNTDGLIDISVKNIHRPLLDSNMSSQVLEDTLKLKESESLKEVTKTKESSVLENSADIVEAVRYVATTEDLSLPLDFNGSPIRRQKPAAH